ncbi:MAG: recombination protein RecR [Planctomycetes bacterium]|nr:recombination protein RecR [Planctomycetota bacterium]MCP4839570.1 recombination protein RecR [Planctomycetota bacterium]
MPGIGRRTATRLAFHLLKAPPEETAALASAIGDVSSRIGCCECCWQLTDVQPCRICADQRRDASCVLVVEQPRDLMSMEATGLHRGLYHVLTGRLDPLGGVGPEDLTIASLLDRVDEPERNAGGGRIEEVILGLSPTLEGDTTAHYISEALATRSVRVTRLARGLPSGTSLEFATPAMLADALLGRDGR